MKKFIFIIVISLFCTSCDTIHHLSGTVVDSSEEMPLDSVRISISGLKEFYFYTDSIGQFNINHMAIGGFLGFPKMNISFEKDGYKSLKNKYPSYSEKPVIIHLSKE